MKKIISLFIFFGAFMSAEAQRTLSLDSCRVLALHNNKQINISKLKQDMAMNIRKAAKTKYLPKVDAAGGYQYFSESISLLNKDEKNQLNNLGTNIATLAGGSLSSMVTGLVQQGVIPASVAQQISGAMGQLGTPMATAGNQIGNSIVKSLETDTHNIWGGAIMVRQPIYMGGAITAINNIAKINESLTENDADYKTQSTLYNIDQAYWLVVSLKQKQLLANSYLNLVKKLNSDVQKMIKEGVATHSDGLRVNVKVNEAEMQVTQVEDGLTLSKMMLCQLCGIPMSDNIILADESSDSLNIDMSQQTDNVADKDAASNNRPELRMLQNSIEISQQATKLVRAEYLPHVLLTGGYLVSNPNIYNSFERKFAGTWNVGVILQVPVWNWFESSYKIRASKVATCMAQMELCDTKEKIDLQITQSQFKVKEAHKKLTMARRNIKSAEENLRCANLGFKEGIMETTDVMTAQTAWQQAQSQKIDAEVEVKLSLVNLQKALGVLRY
ncbi:MULTISPECIES: TolC family protein [Prevotella]|uniref:Alkaline protease n=1 Tax=Prevotella herbatica TaxID=2801997 RepID=A0ABN6EGI2_9BACT|nr:MULTISPECIES: TolC family protein [Prevotella]MDN5553282.1 TolC family protein [Prevotella sp.]BCS84380.1 alkaline protease [Prevotella herbatica]